MKAVLIAFGRIAQFVVALNVVIAFHEPDYFRLFVHAIALCALVSMELSVLRRAIK